MIEFEGIISGDHECFCWDVDEATLRRFYEDNLKHRTSYFNEGLYRLYPDDLFDISIEDRKIKVKMEYELIE
jgi:hypothetical protein